MHLLRQKVLDVALCSAASLREASNGICPNAAGVLFRPTRTYPQLSETREDCMIRVSKNNRCPVCDHPDWCGMTADGRMAICMRVESAVKTKNGGWLHQLSAPLIKPPPKPEQNKKPPADMYALMNRYKLQCTDGLCQRLAGQLGVSPAALRELEIGYDGVNYTFPMRNGQDRVIGIKLRATWGGMFCVR